MAADVPFSQQVKYEREQRGWTQAELASRVGTDTKTVARWENGKTRPRLYYRQKLSEVFAKSIEELKLSEEPTSRTLHREDLNEAPLTQFVYGRDEEVRQLGQWVVDDACQVVSILGLGGIGKTTLASYFTNQVKGEFDAVFWRSVQHAPPLEHILKQTLHFFSNEQTSNIPLSLEESISLLIRHLQDTRCLFVLDNFESLLQPEQHVGMYREGYESYGLLLQRLGETQHNSCLLLTSREKPREVARMEGPTKAVRTLLLSGITQRAGQALLAEKGIHGTDTQWQQLVALYSGNPLALTLVSEYIGGIFGGNVDLFLAEEGAVFGDVDELLEQQFRRLTLQEQEILFWLAIEREAPSLERLRADFAHPISRGALLEALHSLQRRSLIEPRGPGQFTLQPVIMEFVTDKLVRQACKEFHVQVASSWTNYAFMMATASNYIRENQQRLILYPIAAYLQRMDTRRNLLTKLQQKLAVARDTQIAMQGYLTGNIINLLSVMEYDLRDIDFSSLAIWQAYLQGLSLIDVDFAHASFRDTVFTHTFGNILSVTFNAHNNLLATGSTTGEIGIYTVPDEKLLHTFSGHTDGVWSLAFSPDSELLASSSDDRTIRLWNMSNHECRVLQGHENRVRSVAFNADATLLASGSDDETIGVWNVQTGELLHFLKGHTNRVWSVAFSPDGKLLASGSTDTTIRLWDISTRQCQQVLAGHTNSIRSLAFSPDGNILVSAGDDQTIRTWHANQNFSSTLLRGHTNRVWSVAFSPEGTLLASGSEDSTVRLWNAQTGALVNILQNHTHGVRSVAFSPDGQLLASGGEDQAVCLWSVESGYCLRKMQGYTNRVWSIAFGANSNTLVSASEDHTIRLWHTDNATRRSMVDHNHAARCIAVSTDGTILASGGQDQKVWLWNTSTGSRITALQGHTNWVWSVAFSPDGRTHASGSEDTTIKLWDIATYRELHTLVGHTSWIRAVAFNNAQPILASGSDDTTIKLWDVTTGSCIHTLQGHTHRVRSIAFSPDGNLLVSSSEDGTILLWNVQTRMIFLTLKDPTSWTRSVQFSPDNRTLATGTEDGSLHLWSVDRGQHLAHLTDHTSRIRSISFSADGTILASGSDDGTIRLWDTATHQCSKTLRSERPYERMNISHVTGLTEGQKAALKALGAIEETI